MATDDEKREDEDEQEPTSAPGEDPEEQAEEPSGPEEPPEAGPEPEVDPRDARIAELEARLVEANARADLLGQALFTARVAATDLLADPSAMPYSPELVDADTEALTAAVLALVAADPGLGKLRVTGDIGQDEGDVPTTPPASLLNILKEFV